MPTLVFGDLHGDFSQILAHGLYASDIILLGDLEPPQDLRYILGSMADKTWYILGNHDVYKAEYIQRLDSMRERCLHRNVVIIGGLRVAGINGVFNKEILDISEFDRFEEVRDLHPSILTRTDWSHKNQSGNDHLAEIFMEDLEYLANMKADVLVLHEAPESHPNGFHILGDLARCMGARLIIHGHHHERYERYIEGGVKVLGLGLPGQINSRTQLDEGLEWMEDVFPC
ncbi:metallophosphoesterase family protein [Desulfonatronum parangueonense]